MRLKNQKGFTLIELILVIVILGILAVAALPTFTNISGQAGDAAMLGVVGAVRSSVGIYYSNELASGNPGTYPAGLDAAAVGACTSNAAPCFGNVITNGIVDPRWNRDSATAYTYTNPDTTNFPAVTWTYDPATGSFTRP